jgi:hypothetical protein
MYQEIFWGSILINEIWIEYVELVALHNLWGRVIHVIVSLIILVPFKASMYPEKDIQLAPI